VGFDLATFLREAVKGGNVKATHLDGAFITHERALAPSSKSLRGVVVKKASVRMLASQGYFMIEGK